MNLFLTLLQKELKEAFRDRRGLMAAFAFAFLSPVMIFVVSKTAIRDLTETPPAYIQIEGAVYAGKLVEHLERRKIFPLDEAPVEERKLWQDRDIKLTIAPEYELNIREGIPAEVFLSLDFSNNDIQPVARRIQEAINRYSQTTAAQRLILRGLDVNLLRPINLIERDTASPGNNTGFITIMLVMYLMMAAFFSSISVAIDSSAGERERNVLELLLCQPVTTLHIVLAKLSSAATIAILGATLTLLLSCWAVSQVELSKLGLTFQIDTLTILTLLMVILPICLFAATLQLFTAFQAKSFKEAQSIVTMVLMLPAMMPVVMTFLPNKPDWLGWTPIAGQYLLIDDIFKGAEISAGSVFVTGSITIVISALMVAVLAYRLKSEKVVLAL